MKIELLLNVATLYVMGLVLATNIGAETFTSASPTTAIELLATDLNHPNCPPSTACPRVLACDAGYSCQPDKTGDEEQQYLPASAIDWVLSLGCDEFIDVPIGDPRWANREEGEVYAQESDNCLAFYWPEGGEAKFDISVTLDSPATWHDFLLSDARPPGSGNFTIQPGKQRISFNAGNTGGMVLFVAIDEVKPPRPQPDGFFTSYVNLQRDKLPTNRIYPIGQKMMISWYNPTTPAEISKMHAHGFTAAGPWENAWGVGFDFNAVIKRVNDLDMRSWLFMHMGKAPNGNPLMAVYGTCNALRAGMTPQEIGARAHNTYSKYSKGNYKATADALMHFPEEMSQRLDSCDKSTLLASNNAVTDTLLQDWPNIPFIKSETSSTALTQNDFNNVHGRISAPMRQYYFSDQTNLDVIPYALNRHLKLFNNLKAVTMADRPKIDKRIVGVIPDWTRDPASGNADRYTDYYMTTSLIKGVQSFSFAQYAHLETPPASPSMKLKAAWFKTVKKVTDCGIDDAFLWGTDDPPGGKLTFTRTSGPAKSVRYNLPSMLVVERQYEQDRYILMTNSHKSNSIEVSISGLPSSYRIRDCMTSKVSEGVGNKKVTLPAWGSAMYKVSK